MFNFKKNHDPRKNPGLLAQINRLDIKEAVHETEQLFKQCLAKEIPQQPNQIRSQSVPFSQKAGQVYSRIFSKTSKLSELTGLSVDAEGNVSPDWKEKLEQEFSQLMNIVTREVNVGDYGAVGDGKTDNTAAFKKAVGNGRVKVIVPAGVFITKGIVMPSWTCIIGAGKGLTTIKLHDLATKGTRLITNANHWKGNHHLFVQGMSLDWNVERLGNAPKTSTGGNHSSCLTYANVTYGWVKNVEAINPGLHCFDISSTLYNYAGDGYRGKGGSKYVWLENLNGYGFGDDGITTHHSEYIYIAHSHMCDPSGRAHRKGFSNSNGFEIDDGSRNVVLVNNSSARCFGGVEIKAHQNSSAAANVQIVGHISINDNRAYNFRHIGHHKSTDPESKTAYNITATNLAAIAPIFTDLYLDSSPRGLVVSAYKNVVINHFTLIGNPEYDYKNNPVIAVQYRARNIVLNEITLQDFKKAGADIKVFGGENKAEGVQISNVLVDKGASKAIKIGSGIQNITVKNIKEASNSYF
jgi:hypothetical protein